MTNVASSAPSDAGSSGRHLPLDAVAVLVGEHYDLTVGHLALLGGETDQNMRVDTSDGTTWFARLSAAPHEQIAWQNSLLEHLAATAPDLPLPRLRRSAAGDLWHETKSRDGVPLTLRLMSWLPGRTLAQVAHHPEALLRQLGSTAGRLSAALATMAAPAYDSTHDWDMRAARDIVAAARDAIEDPTNTAHVDTAMSWYDEIAASLDTLPQGVVHHDLNDANVLVGPDDLGRLTVTGLVDVGDALHSARVTELAIASAYAMVRKDDPLEAATAVVAGFHDVVPLTPGELAVVYPLALARLCMNAATWNQRVQETGSEYGRARMHDTWPTLAKAVAVHPVVAEETLRLACGLAPTDQHIATCSAVSAHVGPTVLRGAFGGGTPVATLDLRPASDLWDGRDWTATEDVRTALDEARNGDSTRPLHLPHLWASMLRASRRTPGLSGPATVQLGAAILLPAGSPIHAPLAAVVEAHGTGGRLVLRHGADEHELRTVWYGLDASLLGGTRIEVGDVLGIVADTTVDGTAVGQHLLGSGIQVQVASSAELALLLPRFVRAADRETWRRVSPDPAALLGVEPPADVPTVGDVLAMRRRHLASSQRSYYREPMNLVRGRDVWFYDEDALGYLDSLNNVTHVGHAEPRVSLAAHRQLRKLNTNSRFVYPQIAEFAERLIATLPEPLQVVFLVCTGSEANDLALRIARQVTGRRDIVIIDGAYHGNTGWVTGISPNRYKGPGGQGAPATTHEVTMPDRYRGRFGYDDPDAGSKYAALAKSVIARISGDGRTPAAFIAESLMGSAGNIVHPPGYLAGVFDAARAAGALCVSDEVQVGVGRLGPWWGFELHGVVPDIVTMGKPLGNGHPLAALVTTREIADAFDTGMKYFNTFGGNPVSCAIGSTVLDIVKHDGLREHAVDVGGYFAQELRALADRQQLIGDVRAEGLYLGVELVRDRETRQPGRSEALLVTELTKERGVVVFPNGVHDNVLKIKPPMTFTRHHVDLYVDVLDEVLTVVEAMRPDHPIIHGRRTH